MLQQQITIEVIAQEDATSQYHVRTDDKGQALSRPIFYTEIPVCWTKDPDHNILISAFVWGNEVQNDNPTAEEMGLFALRAAEIKKGDIVLLTGRLCGTADGTLTFVDPQKVTTAANLQMTVQGFAVTGSTNVRSVDLHPLQQMVFFEAFVGTDAKAGYSKNNTFFAKFTACWSKGPEEKLWFDATVWGKKVPSDKPTAEEAGSFAVWTAENVKEGDRVLLIGRLAGSKEGRVNLYTKGREVRASYLDVSINSLSITEKKANRAIKPAPAEADTPLQAAAIPVVLSTRPVLPMVSSTFRPALPTSNKRAVPVIASSLPLPPTPKPVVATNPFARFKKS
ncbi:MAG TPA: hypothetical protein VFR47_12875 [Anaerolineales bacterium]|nr:hypothetical protein [Anaerolineales bacterium]